MQKSHFFSSKVDKMYLLLYWVTYGHASGCQSSYSHAVNVVSKTAVNIQRAAEQDNPLNNSMLVDLCITWC